MSEIHDKFLAEINKTSSSDVFAIEPVHLQFNLNNLICMRTCGNKLVLALKNGHIYRIDLDHPEIINKIELFGSNGNNSSGRIKNMFLDPSGNHLFVMTTKKFTFYINQQSNTPVLLSKWKNLHVSCIQWTNFLGKDTVDNIKNFLVGTQTGEIYESSLDYRPSSGKVVNPFLQLVWRNPISSNSEAIDGIFIDRLSCSVQEDTEKVYGKVSLSIVLSDSVFYYNKEITAKTAKNSLLFNNFFEAYQDYERIEGTNILQGNKFISDNADFAWLIKNSILFTNLHDIKEETFEASTKETAKKDSILSKFNHILNHQLPENRQTIQSQSILLTRYHIIYLRNNEIIIINKVNQQIVYHKYLPILMNNEKFLGLSADYEEQTFWIYSNFNIFEITVNNEFKDIWKIYFKNGQFDNALTLIEKDETLNKQFKLIMKDLILIKKSDSLMSYGRYDKAAEIYSHTSKSFENVCLKLLDKNQYESLLLYLTLKLQYLGESKDFYIQKVLLSSWIVELYEEIMMGKAASTFNEKLKLFLKEHADVIEKSVVYQILQNHNDQQNLLYYANLISDYDFVLNYWINLENWDESLKILEKKNDSSLIYKYSNILLINSPLKTVNLWIRLQSDLDYTKFIPSMLNYSKIHKNTPLKENIVLKYLEFLIDTLRVQDSIIHNIYLSILDKYEESENEIIKYLEKFAGDNELNFDSDYVLRLFKKSKKYKPLIHVYSKLKDYDNAVSIALDNNHIKMACLIADKCSENKNLRKKLWLKVAKKMINKMIVEKVLEDNSLESLDDEKISEIVNSNKSTALLNSDNDDVKELLKYLLNKCELLTIKDLLPLFPEFTSINNFKIEIIKNLESYGLRINQLNSLISNSIKFNDKLIEDLKELKLSRFYLIESENSTNNTNSFCQICNNSIFFKRFLVFPCQHCFHFDCLIGFIMSSSNKKNYKLKKNLAYHLQKNNYPAKSQISKELQEILVEKCVLCSDLNIEGIDDPFVDYNDDKDKKLMEEWEI